MNSGQVRQKPGRYDFTAVEAKWQRHWEEHHTFRTPNSNEASSLAKRPKFYILDMFPYPSGAGLHVGHPLGYCATDILARYKRMRGFNVLHPMGFDAFGLPAEQYAIETNIHPAVTTTKNIEMYRRQLKMFGFSYDWDREFATSDPSYYKFTQWMFGLMRESWYDEGYSWIDAAGRQVKGRARAIRHLIEELESDRITVDADLDIVRGRTSGARSWKSLSRNEQSRVIDGQRLAYLDEVPVNWCPALGTVLSNEEVDSDGRSERGGHPVYRRPLRQWMLRITKYAERLADDLEHLDWPEPIKLMQRNWVGKSTGAEVIFPLAAHWKIEGGKWVHQRAGAVDPGKDCFPDSLRIFTTRPDTLYGATYMVLAPEHPLVESVSTESHRKAVMQYVLAARNRSELDRTADTKEKTGVFTGAFAFNPVNGVKIPIWVADYVLMGYGTGAIMAVPGSDTRDFEFARRFDLSIVSVVRPTNCWIKTQIENKTRTLDKTAREGLDRLAREVPELAEAVTQHRNAASGLSERTVAILLDHVGASRLVDHYVAHPLSWGEAYIEDGTAVNSPSREVRSDLPDGVCSLNGLPTEVAKTRIIEWLTRTGMGRATAKYKLRDWLFSRQRYWGEPFPVLHGEDGETVFVSEEELPVELPPISDFKPTAMPDDARSLPEPPLARAKEWVSIVRDGKRYHRDLNTMPNWAGSCWYYLRFLDPNNKERFCDPSAERYWMPVDLYVGGAEHAVLHLLYARFWHKVLFDLEYVSTSEPFQKLFNQGKIQSFAFRDARGLVVGPTDVEERSSEHYYLKSTGEPVTRIVAKMSKSLKNVVNPDGIIAEYGADTFRLYEMYMGPLELDKPWNTRDVPGLFKLCQRIWRLVVDEETGELSSSLSGDPPEEESLRILHKTIRRVTEELEQFKINTAIAAIFDFVNAMTPRDRRPRAVLEPFILLLSPFAPHLAEELWYRLGHVESLAYEPWPTFDEALTRDGEVEIAVQVNGKIRGRIRIPADAPDAVVQSTAMHEPSVTAAMKGLSVRKVIVAKGRLVNIVAN